MMDWSEIKKSGSQHYKTSSIEPIDLLRDVKPADGMTALGVKALTDIIKYAFRMLQGGINRRDCDKIRHYSQIAQWYVSDERYDLMMRAETKPAQPDKFPSHRTITEQVTGEDPGKYPARNQFLGAKE